MKKIALITVRKGSERLKDKNLLKINNKTILEITIERAINSHIFDEVWVNSDDIKYKQYTDKYGVYHYLRPRELGSSNTPIDDVVYDFMCNVKSDIVAIINTPSPLQSAEEVTHIMNKWIESDADSLMTVEKVLGHCYHGENPLGFNENKPLARTQDLEPIYRCVYAVMAWKSDVFMNEFEDKGCALFCGKNVKIPVNKETCILLKTHEDYEFIKSLASI